MPASTVRFLAAFILIGMFPCSSRGALLFPVEGHPSCPCAMTVDDLSAGGPTGNETNWSEQGPPAVGGEGYGIGCALHDKNSEACRPAAEFFRPECDNVVPQPPQCVQPATPGWCDQAWCYVKRNRRCGVESDRSSIFPGRIYR